MRAIALDGIRRNPLIFILLKCLSQRFVHILHNGILSLAVVIHAGEYRRHHEDGEDENGMICFQLHFLYRLNLLLFNGSIAKVQKFNESWCKF